MSGKEWVIALTVLVTAIFGVFYGLTCRNQADPKKQFDVAVIVEIIFNAAGVVAGTVIVLSTFLPDVQKLVSDLWLYGFISGLVVMIVCGMSLLRRAGWLR